MAWGVYLNEVALDTLGAYVEDLSTRWHAPARQYPSVSIPGRNGVVYAADPTVGLRSLEIAGSIDPSARTLAALQTAVDKLKALANNALVRITVDDDVNAPRAIDGVCTGCEISAVAHPMVTQIARFRLRMECPDPTWYDVTGDMVSFGTTPSAVSLGTAPSGGIVRLVCPSWSAASATTPTLTYANAAGVTLKTLVLSTTLAAGTDYLELDLDRQTIVEYQSGVVRNAIGDLTSGDFFTLDPMDGDVLNGSFPTLACSSAAGTLVGQWYGMRRWL